MVTVFISQHLSENFEGTTFLYQRETIQNVSLANSEVNVGSSKSNYEKNFFEAWIRP